MDELLCSNDVEGCKDTQGDHNGITEEDIIKRHKLEKKELQATIQKIKKNINNCKKRKKEATAEIAKLEADLKEKHDLELKEFHDQNGEAEKQMSELSLTDILSPTNDEPELTSVNPKVSRAAKRRAKKAESAQLRESELEKERQYQFMNSPRAIEMRLMAKLLGERQLLVTEVEADGNCMYAALSHQLKGDKTIENLRNIAADYMLEHEADFAPFVVDPDTGDVMDSDKYASYCDSVANTRAWGGQPELRALSEALKRKIKVIQAEGPDIVLGEQFTSDGALMLAYYRHAFSLGEHYNSVTETPA